MSKLIDDSVIETLMKRRHGGYTSDDTPDSSDELSPLADAGGQQEPHALTDESARQSPSVLFRRMVEPSSEALRALARLMTDGSAEDPAGDSPVPAGYTYFGQFIAHDASHDVFTKVTPTDAEAQGLLAHSAPGTTPFLDLQSVYGAPNGEFALADDLFGYGLARSRQTSKYDARPVPCLKRFEEGHRRGEPMIPDRRNDDNVVLASIHLLFQLLHNAFVLKENMSAEDAKQQVVWHYQRLALEDYLPRIVGGNMRNPYDVANSPDTPLSNLLCQYADGTPVIPLEVSGAIFRFGHSQIRNQYRWPIAADSEYRAPLRAMRSETGWRRFKRAKVDAVWLPTWHEFFDEVQGGPAQPINMARRVNIWLAPALQDLKHPRAGSLTERTLLRGAHRYNLPCAQELIDRAALGNPLSAAEIEEQARLKIREKDIANDFASIFDANWKTHTPLWLYVLLEAQAAHPEGRDDGTDKQAGVLGPLAAKVMSECLIGLIREAPNNVLEQPDEEASVVRPRNETIRIGDVVNYLRSFEDYAGLK